MGQYIDVKTKTVFEIDEKNFQFPSTGAKILHKVRPPIAREAMTD